MSATSRRLSVASAFCCALALALGSTVAMATPATLPGSSAPPADDPTSGWSQPVRDPRPAKPGESSSTPGADAGEIYELDARRLVAALSGAPLEHTPEAEGALPIVAIPGVDGELHHFRVVESPVMEPALASRVAFRSYAATSVDEPGSTARSDYSPTIGFHATVRSEAGSWNVDPATRGQTTSYRAHTDVMQGTLVEEEMEDEVGMAARVAAADASFARR